MKKNAPSFDRATFIAKYGERPTRSLFDISEDIKNTKRVLAYLEKELFDWEIYDARETVALQTFVDTVYQLKGEKP